MSEVKIQINGVELMAPADYTILQVARLVNVEIPTLCHLNWHDHKARHNEGTCRVCVVERENIRGFCHTMLFG